MKKVTAMILLGAITFTLAGCSADIPFLKSKKPAATESATAPNPESSASSTVSAEEKTEESAPVPTELPVNLFAEEEVKVESTVQELTPTPSAEEEISPVRKAIEALPMVKSTNALMNLLYTEHDNSSFNSAEDLAGYIGQLPLASIDYCISNKRGVEDDAESRARLTKKIVRHAFVYAPEEPEEIHEYFDADGHLLFTIEDMDSVGGQSLGKIRIKFAGSDQGIDFCYDDICIAVLDEFDTFSEDRKAEIGERVKPMTDSEKEANIQKNREKYKKDSKTVREIVGEDKWNAVDAVYMLYPGHPRADDEGFVKISKDSLYVQNLLNTKYFRKRHKYSLANVRNYVVFEDKDGNQLFSFNTSPKTKSVDIYRKDKTIDAGYSAGLIYKTYPEYIDIEEQMVYEEELAKSENVNIDDDGAAEED